MVSNRLSDDSRIVYHLEIEAFQTSSLLQAVMIDPTVSIYNNAIAMINEIFDIQKGVIAPLEWEKNI